MTGMLTTLFTAILAGLVAATTVFAEENAPSSQPPQASDSTTHGHSGMMTMMAQMSPDHRKQMTEMVANCNRMMKSMSNVPTGPREDQAPDRHG